MARGTEVDGLKILLVDDDEDCREFLMTALEGNGVHVTDVEDAENGVEALKGGEFDAVVTDKNLPGMDGISFIRKARGTAEARFLPILILTTESQQEKKIEAKAAGATGWIVKPFEPEKLIQTIQKVMG